MHVFDNYLCEFSLGFVDGKYTELFVDSKNSQILYSATTLSHLLMSKITKTEQITTQT